MPPIFTVLYLMLPSCSPNSNETDLKAVGRERVRNRPSPFKAYNEVLKNYRVCRSCPQRADIEDSRRVTGTGKQRLSIRVVLFKDRAAEDCTKV